MYLIVSKINIHHHINKQRNPLSSFKISLSCLLFRVNWRNYILQQSVVNKLVELLLMLLAAKVLLMKHIAAAAAAEEVRHLKQELLGEALAFRWDQRRS